MYSVTNPATGKVVEEFAVATDAELEDTLACAHAAYQEWRRTPVEHRIAVVREAARLFGERADELARIITLEMGKRLEESHDELGTVVDIFNYYADNGERLMRDEPLEIQGGEAVIRKAPIGTILGIMPWNYPYYQIARLAAPNLALGNTIVLKHSPLCPRSSAAVEELLRDAGLPEGAYINVYAFNEQVADMIADPRIQGVSVTGSERAGAAVAAEAGRNLKRYVLEMGGSDPMVVLDTEDFDELLDTAVVGRMGNMGQTCNAPKRMIVVDSLYDDFVAGLVERMAAFEPGDPAENATLAPLSSIRAAEILTEQIEETVSQGATLHTGGERLDRPGAYVLPAVLTDVRPGMRAYEEELFGPAAIVFRAGDEEEAIEIANDTKYGLGSSIFTSDVDHAAELADRIDAGMVYVNLPTGTQADTPFGGVKRSGVGRELGLLGMDEFVNKKVVRIPR